MSATVQGLNEEERAALAALKKLAKRWPKSLWLFSASGTLHLMRKSEIGERCMTPDGYVDQNASVWSTRDVENDGGDW